ncbi:MAG: metallophosphoesterase [Deltaproteobacteria bacterium]|nr:metallophosphoesterase [Deltaproteobacteria bacterium]
MRIAAAGDLHFDRHSRGRLSGHLEKLKDRADFLLLAGDLTQVGHGDEGLVLAQELATSPVPVIAVFGNHDYHSEQEQLIRRALEQAKVTVLESQVARLEVRKIGVGIVGLKGFGGGFVGACATDFGEAETKAFVRTTKRAAHFIREALRVVDADYKIVLLHYAPVSGTLHGENREIYPFLGSYLLGEAMDQGGADLVVHGHAHSGIERGETPGGVPVRNVAQHVIRHVFNIYTLDKFGLLVRQEVEPQTRGQH